MLRGSFGELETVLVYLKAIAIVLMAKWQPQIISALRNEISIALIASANSFCVQK